MVFLFVFFWDSYDLNVGAFNIVPEVSEIVLISFSFPFFLSDSFISTILSSTSLILFSASIIQLLPNGECGHLGCFSTGIYHWARNLWVLIIYLFFLLVMLPSVVPRLTTDLAVRMFSGVWKLLSFLRLPSQDGSPSLPLLSPFLSFIFCLTSFRRQWAAFLGA